jgi:hypothetical protein
MTVLEVVQLLDGEFEPDAASDPAGIWVIAVNSLREVLGATTVADIVQREAEATGAQMYHI